MELIGWTNHHKMDKNQLLPKVDRSLTPWVVIYGHRPMYCTNDDRWEQPVKIKKYLKQLLNQPVFNILCPGQWYVDNQCLYLLGMTALSLRLAQESDCPCSTGFTLVFVKIINFNTTALFNSTSDQAFLSGGAWRISWRNTGSILLFGLMSIRNFLFCF